MGKSEVGSRRSEVDVSKARNPKPESPNQFRNPNDDPGPFSAFGLRHSSLIRISGFGFLNCAQWLLIFALATVETVRAEAPRYASQLARECDELLGMVVKRPYGWAWAQAEPEPRPKGGAQVVSFEPGGTAAAGFMLYWAGDLLDQPKYKEAAYQAARATAACLRPTGQAPARPVFLPTAAGGRETPMLVADRGPSRAALGLLLCLYDESGGKDEVMRRTAARILSWLYKQQGAAGPWPQAYPPTTAPADAVRLLRLDTSDYRDSVFAMLLTADIFPDDAQARRSVERSLEFLLRARIGNASKIGGPLWATAYGLDAFATDRIAEYQPGVDVLASRQAMAALFAAYVMRGDPPQRGADEDRVPWNKALHDAAAAVEKLPRFGGNWVRIYDYEVEMTPPPPAPVVPHLGIGGTATAPTTTPPRQMVGTFGMDRMLENVAALEDVGREKVLAALSANLTIRQRLGAALCGLEDDPMSAVQWPVTDDEVAEFWRHQPERFKVLDTPVAAGTSVGERTRRLYQLWVAAKLESRVKK
jgi:hypothetical protein